MSRLFRTSLSTLALALAIVPGATFLSLSVGTPAAYAHDENCSDFPNQQKAQKFFRKHHPRQDPDGLDADHDGIACEDNPCPCNHHKPPGFVVGDRRTLLAATPAQSEHEQ